MSDFITVKRKMFEIVERKSDDSFIVKKKDKTYFLRQFPSNFAKFNKYLKDYKNLNFTGIKHPKIKYIDKKRYVVVSEYIKGDNVLDLLLKGELDEKIIEQIFILTFHARQVKFIINPDPSNFIFSGDTLYYMSLEVHPYIEDNNFVNKGIRLWFHTKDLDELFKSKGLTSEYKSKLSMTETNRNIVLMTCKYYN